MKRTRVAVALFTIVAAAATLGAQNVVEQRIRRIENGLLPPVVLKGRPIKTTKLEDRMRELKIPAVSVAVFHNGRIEWLRAWGMADLAARRRAQPDTRFQAASISKPVAAAAALALVSRGRMSLDDDINKYLTSWKLPDNEFTGRQKVTLKHLLTHSGGVTVSGFRGYAKNEEVPTLVQLLDGVKPSNSGPVRVDIPVGSRWRYAGGGYQIVQLAIEDETKKPFAQSARELVLAPFGMSRSTFVQPIPADLREKAATGYRAGGDAVPGNWHTHPEQAAAGLWTTPEDLARFAIELQKIASGKSQKVMSREIATQMLQRHVDEYGLGVGVTGDGRETRFGHGGSNVGFRCYLVAYRDVGSGVAIMTNSDSGAVILQDVVRAVAREYGWPGMNPIERTLGTADPSTYKDFAGRFELPTRSPPVVIQIVVDGDRLFRGTGRARSELMPENATTFFAMDSDFRIEFVRDGSGKVTEAKVSQGGTERTAIRSAGL
jgi:CubicO group peptidase (beta-lactamase class C family)